MIPKNYCFLNQSSESKNYIYTLYYFSYSSKVYQITFPLVTLTRLLVANRTVVSLQKLPTHPKGRQKPLFWLIFERVTRSDGKVFKSARASTSKWRKYGYKTSLGPSIWLLLLLLLTNCNLQECSFFQRSLFEAMDWKAPSSSDVMRKIIQIFFRKPIFYNQTILFVIKSQAQSKILWPGD